MVLTASGVADRPPTNATTQERPSPTEREVGHGASTSFKAGSLGDDYIRRLYQVQVYQQVTTLICNAWGEGTIQQYDNTLRRWGEFCRPREFHPITPPINDVVEFLSYLYDNGGRFGVIATARSTLGYFIHVPGVPVLANHPLIQKVVKGAYNTRPPAPPYVVIWDTDVLLQYLDSLENTCLDFKLLSCKTAILLTIILSGQRVSTIHAFRLSQLQLTTDMAIFNLGTTLLKHSRPGRSNPPIVFPRYPHGRRLCPLQTIRDYVTKRTLLAPQIAEFLITHRKPYHPASKDTLARWVKDMLHFSEIDTALLLPPWNKF